jgi:hypothetical protein
VPGSVSSPAGPPVQSSSRVACPEDDARFTSRAARGDRKRWTLEVRLPQLLRELETQAVEAEEQRLARERDEAERQRQWEVAMDRAKLRLVEDHRVGVLRTRVGAWHEADAIRAYCEAVETRHGAETIAANPDAAQWLAFAREHADRAQRLPRMPADPEITHEALKPYLGKWSPYSCATGWNLLSRAGTGTASAPSSLPVSPSSSSISKPAFVQATESRLPSGTLPCRCAA